MLPRSLFPRIYAVAAVCALHVGAASALTSTTTAPALAYVGNTVGVVGMSTESSDTAMFRGSIDGPGFSPCGVRRSVLKQGTTKPLFDYITTERGFAWETRDAGIYYLRAAAVAMKSTGECLTTTTGQAISVPLRALPADPLTVTTRLSAARAPATVILQAKPKDAAVAAVLAGATYHWHVSGGALMPLTSLMYESKSSAMSFRSAVGYEMPSMYMLRVSIGDFYLEVPSGEFTVPPAPPPALAAAIRPAQRWSHAPMKMMVAPTVTSMVPGEIIAERSFTVNGAPITVLPGRPFTVDAPTAGTYTIEGMVRTNKLRSATMTYSVQVPEPDTPTCSLTVTPFNPERGIYKFVVTGASTTGYIAKYLWRQGDRAIPISSNTALLRMERSTDIGTVGVTVLSDAGVPCSATASLI